MYTESRAHGRNSRLRWLIEPALVAFTVGGLSAGGIAWLLGWRGVADSCWIAGTVLAIAPALVWVLVALRRGRVGVDVIALLSLVGTLLVGEYLAGALIAVMLAGGRALDAAAEHRASRDLRALLERAPRFARRRVEMLVSAIPVAEVAINDVLIVGPGEVVPVDGRIADVVAVLDESALTGEPLQVERAVGEPVRSGVVNAGSPFEPRATATADDSTYAGIVRQRRARAEQRQSTSNSALAVAPDLERGGDHRNLQRQPGQGEDAHRPGLVPPEPHHVDVSGEDGDEQRGGGRRGAPSGAARQQQRPDEQLGDAGRVRVEPRAPGQLDGDDVVERFGCQEVDCADAEQHRSRSVGGYLAGVTLN